MTCLGFTGTQGIIAMYDVNSAGSFANTLLGMKQAENNCVFANRIISGKFLS